MTVLKTTTRLIGRKTFRVEQHTPKELFESSRAHAHCFILTLWSRSVNMTPTMKSIITNVFHSSAVIVLQRVKGFYSSEKILQQIEYH